MPLCSEDVFIQIEQKIFLSLRELTTTALRPKQRALDWPPFKNEKQRQIKRILS